MDTLVSLFCLLCGEATEHAFPVKIAKEETVGDLKKLIKAEKAPDLDTFPADKLTLWSVSITSSDDTAIPEFSRLAKHKLQPVENIGEVFPSLQKKHIHIIVDVPSVTASLPEQVLKSENGLMAEFVTLFCLVRGDTTNHAFSVKIDRSGTVDELKELIKAKDPDSFGNVNAKLLSVWKVSLPIDTITPSLFAVLGQELLPTEEISELYPENPPKKAVHIIVDAPGKKGTPKKDKLCFSKHKNLEAVLAKFGITGSSIRPVPDFHPKRISIDDDNFDFLHCVNDLKAKMRGFGISGKVEAFNREFISSVLLASVLLVPETHLEAERSVEGDDVRGRIDYTMLKGEELICASEAKESNMLEGFSINLMQCTGSIQENKRKRQRSDDDFDYIYGVITTGTQWWYVMTTSEGKVFTTANLYTDVIPFGKEVIKDDTELKRAVKKITATIAWMLQDRAGVDGMSSAKKRRVENSIRET